MDGEGVGVVGSITGYWCAFVVKRAKWREGRPGTGEAAVNVNIIGS